MNYQSEEINELAAALADAQAEMENPAKNAENPHFRSRYADLANVINACRGPLAEHGLSIVQAPLIRDNGMVLRTTLMHTSGQWIAAEFPIACNLSDPQSILSKPQSIGSLLTYARRYSLAGVVGIAQEDDDANDAQAQTSAYPSNPVRQAINEYRAQPARSNGHGIPTTGRALFAWIKDRNEDADDLLRRVNLWAKRQEFPTRIVDWDATQVRAAWDKIHSHLNPEPTPDRGDAYEDDDDDVPI